MFKKILTTILVAAVLAWVPLMTGCEQDDIKTERHTEVHDQVIHQDTVVTP